MSVIDSPLIIPHSVIGMPDINRLYREIELIENFMGQDSVRLPGSQSKLPATSRVMDDFCRQNSLNLLHADDRQTVLVFFKQMKKKAPVLHISFAVEASPSFITKIIVWSRENIDPHVLVQVGLAPSIIAGCVVRTTNKVFNFGLKQRFDDNKSILVEQIRTLG